MDNTHITVYRETAKLLTMTITTICNVPRVLRNSDVATLTYDDTDNSRFMVLVPMSGTSLDYQTETEH